MSSLRNGNESGYPRDLRLAGRPDDPLFNRPLVYGRITPEGGVVETRDRNSGETSRHEIRLTPVAKLPVPNREKALVEVKEVVNDPDVHSSVESEVKTDEQDPRIALVAEMYNGEATYAEMCEKLQASDYQVNKLIKQAVKLKLIKEMRGRGNRPTKRSESQSDTASTPSAKKGDDRLEVLASSVEHLLRSSTAHGKRIAELTARVDAKKSPPSGDSVPGGPGIALLEDMSKELALAQKEISNLVVLVSELTNRVMALESRVAPDFTRDLLQILKLTLEIERRKIA